MKLSPSILIVDDETFLLKIYRACLSLQLGITEVVTCSKSQDGLDALQTTFDLIITDLCREKVDSGLDLIRAAQKPQPQTPIILASGFVQCHFV